MAATPDTSMVATSSTTNKPTPTTDTQDDEIAGNNGRFSLAL